MFKFAILIPCIMAVSAVPFGHQLDSKSPMYVSYAFINFFCTERQSTNDKSKPWLGSSIKFAIVPLSYYIL